MTEPSPGGRRRRKRRSLGWRLVGVLLLVAGVGAGMIFLWPTASDCLPIEPTAGTELESGSGSLSRFLTDTLGPVIGYPLSHVRWRRGYLQADPKFRDRLIEILQPFDIIVVKNGYKLTDRIIPGMFGHAAIWLGDEAQLRETDLWEHPSVVPLQGEIRAGRAVVEAVPAGAELVSIDTLVDTDRMAVIRVRPPDHDVAAWRCDLATLVIGQLHQPYDYSFDVESLERVSCAELVYRTFRDVAWATRVVFGRRTLLPDDLVRLDLSDEIGVDLVAYFTGEPDGSWQERPVGVLAAELEALCEE